MSEGGNGPSETWPEACQSMNDMTGWREVDCATRERFFGDWHDKLGVFSTLTDRDGNYGPGVVYTEWGVKDGGKPWLRDYLWTGSTCRHYMPTANTAWPPASVDESHRPEATLRWSCADGTCARPEEHECASGR